MHVVSHKTCGAATATPTERAARAETGAKATNEPVAVDRDATDAAVARQRLEAAEKNARAHARRADSMEKRAVAATKRVKELENAAGIGIPTTGGVRLERAEEAERAAEQQERRQAVRLVSTRGIDKERTRSVGVGLMNIFTWAYLLLSAIVHCVMQMVPIGFSPNHLTSPEAFIKSTVEHDQIARVVDQRGRRLLFRAWNRLCLHAAALDAVEEAYSATATSRPARDAAGVKRTTAKSSGLVAAKEKLSTEGRRLEEELRRKRAKITVREMPAWSSRTKLQRDRTMKRRNSGYFQAHTSCLAP